MNGFDAHIAGDKKNDKIGIKYGSRLTKINNKRVEGLSYDEIFEILQKCKAPITLYFKEFADLYTQWSKATDLKEEANNLYKEKKTEAAIEKESAAAAFQTVVKLNPSFKKATDRLNECFKELEKENAVIEKRRSSQQKILKEQFQTA